ncbi:U-box domain-containing protein 35 [Senna tora]|uniref:U-box domain-containing protein 35 n=1 Tax=Senna tora TaxID=362788 RepID=A0A834X2F5_9FABA|nr:U-box domain-containing protein 35 [Senna tora]
MQFGTSQTKELGLYCSSGVTSPPSYRSPCIRIQGIRFQDMHQEGEANLDDEFCTRFLSGSKQIEDIFVKAEQWCVTTYKSSEKDEVADTISSHVNLRYWGVEPVRADSSFSFSFAARTAFISISLLSEASLSAHSFT